MAATFGFVCQAEGTVRKLES